jgi:hypothetical protein
VAAASVEMASSRPTRTPTAADQAISTASVLFVGAAQLVGTHRQHRGPRRGGYVAQSPVLWCHDLSAPGPPGARSLQAGGAVPARRQSWRMLAVHALWSPGRGSADLRRGRGPPGHEFQPGRQRDPRPPVRRGCGRLGRRPCGQAGDGDPAAALTADVFARLRGVGAGQTPSGTAAAAGAAPVGGTRAADRAGRAGGAVPAGPVRRASGAHPRAVAAFADDLVVRGRVVPSLVSEGGRPGHAGDRW